MPVREKHILSETLVMETVAAIFVLREDGAALLQHRDNKLNIRHPMMWGPPGGHVEANETELTCAKRELFEETDYFEENLSGEIQSRITTDTTLIQSVIGSSVSIALRNLLLMLGGTIFLFVTNPKLTSIVLISIPFVLGPIMSLGRKVRSL